APGSKDRLSLQNIPIDAVIIEVDRLVFDILASAATPARCAGRPHLDVEELGSVASGEPRLTATTDGLASFRSQTTEANTRRPNLLGLATARMGLLEIFPDDRQS